MRWNLVENAANLVENALNGRHTIDSEKFLQACFRVVNLSIAGNMERCNFALSQLEQVSLSDTLKREV